MARQQLDDFGGSAAPSSKPHHLRRRAVAQAQAIEIGAFGYKYTLVLGSEVPHIGFRSASSRQQLNMK